MVGRRGNRGSAVEVTRSGHPRGRRRNADHGGSGPEEPTRHDGGDADTISGGSGPPIVDDSALRGRILGRFVIIDKVGQGGMGEVHRAYDPTLQREVALKLVRTGGRDGGDDDERQQRTLREAQAMARISHPNVVPVFDAWTQGQQVCIAMEYVAGQTLRRWVGDGSRSVEQILAVYVQAGRGLAAAHRQGMVHRDFKPDNVIVDEDGRARVLDFGLALAVSQQDTPAPSEDPPSGDSSPGDWSVSDASASGSERLTRTGAVMGTPAYMAPEQHFGATAEPAADQFAFCVALYEALCGQRPFVGANLAEVARAKSDGRIPPPPESSAVPKHVRLALERGMAVEPTDRWPSMEALLEVLARRRRSRWWWLAGAAAAAGMVSLLLAEPEARCDASQSSLSSAWSDERREATRRGLMKVDAEGEAIAGGVVARLDQYFADWEAQYVDACERTHVRRDQSAALMDREENEEETSLALRTS